MQLAEHPELSLVERAANTAEHDDRAAVAPRASGFYRRRPLVGRLPIARRDELRLDVDGHFAQSVASGMLRGGLTERLHWVARLAEAGPLRWTGTIFYRDGTPAMPDYTQVEITVAHGGLSQARRASVAFSGGIAPAALHIYEFVARTFDRVEFEFDATADAHPTLAIQTHAHPVRPADLPDETLSIAKVYARAGFNVDVTPAGPTIPIEGAGVDGVWSDTEMHDAMQAHWSRFANRPQSAMWVFHAALHEQGPNLGGIMFDDIGENHRQGTAIFTESFISQAPAGDPAREAWVERMRFWTACHEMGHAFNLAHSWQKSLGTPWVPLADEPEARSFMNYPYNVGGGQTAFFGDFRFRFSDDELLFMRHAPRRFVQMGNADWFDHHAFEEAAVSPEPKLALTLRLNRETPRLQFMEPAMLELKATNTSAQPLVLPEDLLDGHHLTLVVKRGDLPARLWQPFATDCREPRASVLMPGESVYAPLFVGAGKAGWLVAEPGRYRLQASLRLPDGEDIVSGSIELRVSPPAGYDEEVFAQDLFTHDVGRVLAFDGTRELKTANETLRETVERLPARAVSTHARVALGLPLRRAGKVLRSVDEKPKIEAVPARPDDARALLAEALVAPADAAAATLGHVEYRGYVEAYAGWLAQEGEVGQAKQTMTAACETMARRNVKPQVVAQMRAFGEGLAAGGPSAG